MLPYPLWLISSRKGSRYTQVRFLVGVLGKVAGAIPVVHLFAYVEVLRQGG